MKKRLLCLFLTLTLVLSFMPTIAFADTTNPPEGAVAYVTTTGEDTQPIDAGEAGPDGENDLGGGYYKTLQAAIDAAGTTPATVQVQKSFSVEATGAEIKANQNITLDLNGYTVANVVMENGASYVIKNGGELTVVDSSEAQTGLLTNSVLGDIAGNWWSTPQRNYATNVITNYGKVTVESGTIMSTAQGNIAYCVDNNGGGTELIVNGGHLYNFFTNAVRMVVNSKEKENKVTVNGGLVEGYNAIWVQNYGDGCLGTVTVNGGEIKTTAKAGVAANSSYGIYNNNNENVTDASGIKFNFNTGTINENISKYYNAEIKIDYGYYAGTIKDAKSGKFISGGYFNHDVSDYVVEGKYCIRNHDTTDEYGVNVSGYKYKIGTEQGSEEDYVAKVIHSDETVTYYYEFSRAISAAVNGETVVLLKNAQELPNTTNFFIKSITVDLGGYTVLNKNSYGFILDNGITATFKNGTITGASRAFHCQKAGNSLTLENVTLTSNEDSSINVGSGSTTVTFEGKNNISSLNSDCIASYGTITIDAKAGSETTITANASGCDGIFSYGGIAINGTGKLDVTGVNAGAHVYQYYACSNTYGLEITNSNATFTCSKNAVEVSHYYNEGYYGDNTSVHITGGTYNGPVSIESIWKTDAENLITGGTFNDDVKITSYYVNTTITGGTYKEDVSIYNKDKYDATISGGTFSGLVYVENKYANANVTISDGTFNDMVEIYELSGYYDTTNAKGDNVSVTGGKFAVDLSANYYDSSYKSAKVISGGIFANGDTLLYGGTEYYTSWPDCIDPAYAKAANTDEDTMIDYPFTVKPLEIKVNPETIENATKKDIEGNDLPEAAEEKVEEALENTLNNTAVGLFVETGIDEATNTKTVQNVDDTSFNISMVLDAVKEAAKNASKNLASNEVVDADAAATANGQITISDEQITDAMIDKKVNVDLEASKIEVTMDTQNPEQVSMTTVNGATFDVKPTATVTITDGTTGEVISEVTAVIPNEAITSPITFRLPVDPQIGANLKITSVWHSDTKENFKKDYLGVFPIQCENGEYFIELSANEFSYYTYENMMNITDSHRVAIRDTNGNYTGFKTLAEAITAFNAGTDDENDATVDNAKAIILLDDIKAGKEYIKDGDPDTVGNQPVTEADTFDFGNKVVELDLSGHDFIADPETGTGVTNATGVTVINSDTKNQITLAATGVYANNVRAFVMDGYDTRTKLKNGEEDFNPAVNENVINNEVFNNINPDNYTIEVITSTDTDRDDSNDETAIHTGNRVDVYADDTVTVQVKVNGARFTAADVTLTWDKDLFTDTTSGRSLPKGWVKGSDDNDNTYRFTSPKGSDSYYDEGTVLGTFTFKANYLDEATIANASKNPATFTVKNEAHPAKVIGGWGVTLEDSTTNPVPAKNLKDDTAKILLMNSMVGAVEGNDKLIYKGSEIDQKLLNNRYNNNKGWSAKVAGNDVTGAKIQYCVLTKEEVKDGITPGSDGHAYSEWTEGNTVPTKIDADTYIVYYRIKANGYETVEGSREVTIAKQPVTLTWTAPANFTGSYTLFIGDYNASGFSAPTAKFSNLDGGETTLTASEIQLTSGSAGMKDVGSYVFTAVEPKNYSFTNPTANVKVNGLDITGWQLTATNAADATPTVGVIFRDGEEYTIGKLNIANNASIVKAGDGYKDANGNPVTNVKIVYEYFEGKYYKEGDTIPEGKEIGDEIWTVTTDPTATPKYSALGEYKLRMTVTADNYEKLEQEVTFTIKNPIFKYETNEYVAGYTQILVYTNETGVTFKYDTQQMYDETIFGYRWHNTESYSKVYGIVIKGNADESKILASNAEALSLGLPTGYDNTEDASICDVNNKTTAKVNLDDMTAVQSIYNVNAGNMQDMQLVLRSDVNRDKKVDTIGDVAKVMAHYLTLPQGN